MIDSLNILLVEDTDTDAEIVKRALKKTMNDSFSLTRVVTMAEAETILSANLDIDLVLLDLELPDTNVRMDTFQRIENARKSDFPVLVLTSVNDRCLAVEMVGGGAEDYVRKSRIIKEPESLYDAIDFAIRRHKNTVGIKKQKEKDLGQKDQYIQWMTGG